METKPEDTLTYKLTYNLFFIISKSIRSIFIFCWYGITKMGLKYEPLAFLYLLLAAATIFSFIFFTVDIGITGIIIILLIAFIAGAIWNYKYEYPTKKRRKLFNDLFEEVKLYTYDKVLPYYLKEEIISPFLMELSFRTTVPIDVWRQKKDNLETNINIKILDIYQSKDNYQIVKLLFQMEPLPDQIEWEDDYITEDKNILNIGVSTYGIEGVNLDSYPHVFIAGETGSGKSNILKCLIHQSLLKGYEVVLIDFKRGVSFSNFINDVNVYYEYTNVMEVLKNMVQETSKRLDLFREYKVDNLKDYNTISDKPLKRTIIFIDELAELLKVRDREISNILNDSLETLTRLSRAVGINLIMGIQRPDSTIVNGQIKNNVPYRVCGRFTDKEPSRIMLADDIASTLPNIKGRFIIKDDKLKEVQAFYFSNNSTIYNTSNFNNNSEEDMNDYKEREELDIPEEPEETNQSDLSKTFDFDFSDLQNK